MTHKFPTQAQLNARRHNDQIRQLRMLYCVVERHFTSGIRRGEMLKHIDDELAHIGAQRHSERMREERDAMINDTGYYKGYGKRRRFIPNPEKVQPRAPVSEL